MPNFKICLCFSDTGGGHRKAVEAIEAAIREIAEREGRGHAFEIISDNIVENSHPLNRCFVDLYNYLLRNDQQAMRYYYWFIHNFKPNDSDFGYRLSGTYAKRLCTDLEPDVLVSVHPMTNQYLVRARQETGMADKIKFVTVVTDPNGELWRGWACPEADLTVVPNDLARERLIAWGVPHKKIRQLGMPVGPEFSKPPTMSKEEFRHHLGLYRDRLTVCINAGWAGGGNMLAIYRALEHADRPIQAIVLCGHNRHLYEQARRESKKSPIPTAVLPFHDRMADLMAATDLMVTKAGGVTTYEAIARRLPLAFDMITEPMPQEMGTVRLLVDYGLASALRRPSDIVKLVETFEPVADRQSIKLPEAHCLDRTSAVYDIARAIMSYCDPLYQPIEEHRPVIEQRH